MGGGETVLFWVLAPVMVLGALGLVFAKKAVHAALCMALVMIGLGIVYFAQQAPFLGSVQIFVYTGAVMMLFLFVLMLVGIDSSDSLIETIKGQRAAATVLGIGAAVLLVSALRQVTFARSVGLTEVNANPGNITSIAGKIFGQYVWAFEVTGALLITAAVGAMMLAHRERLVPRPSQRELSEKRIREGAVKAPLPAPGVFARHNAVDTPALLPDGTPSELSVSRVLATRGQMLGTQHHVDEINAVRDELENPLTHEADVADDGTSVLGPNEGARK
ncbi:NADH-quinone oxidoreductase subunit J [Kineosporia sp. R_H_3]|uniref:NADH-quinone oxidoreductase subunit J n=1 Tax=Kineosporia sp. R_H_3 TaxID=1961848 RepID=UPI003510436F